MNKKIQFILLLLLIHINQSYSTPILLTSIPKCGTWLLGRCILFLTDLKPVILEAEEIKSNEIPKPGTFFINHIFYDLQMEETLKRNKFKVIFIYRDPRDQIISLIFYVKNHADWFPDLARLTADQLIKKWLADSEEKSETLKFYTNFLQWKKVSFCYSLRFEDLIGSKGGGSDSAQRNEIINIASHLSVANAEEKIDYCIENLFGESPTFREGKIGAWKTYYTQEQKTLLKQRLGNLLIELGYEKNLDW